MVIPNAFPERPGWVSAKDYFINNGSDSPNNRSKSPDKITTPPRGQSQY